ncbi:MAG: DUF4838 domain-containing protein, partial [Armatimonadetes bacterium]|nr:DUF4838 domain-containing protein [Candidatus Hippobium faecium]
MKKVLLTLFIALSVCSVFAFTVTDKGAAKASVILSDSANPAEIYAEKEFVKYIKAISGAELPVLSAPAETGNIFIGQTETALNIIKKKNPSFTWESLKTDGIVILCDGNNLVLAGDNSGTIYAVYTFLEDVCGVKYLTPDDEYIPAKKTINCNNSIFKTHKSPFMSRDSFFTLSNYNPTYELKLKLNGHHNPVPKELGGHVVLHGFAHTFNTLLNPDVYGKTHPEWFCEINGQRMATRLGQLCLSNQDMVKELIKNVLTTIQQNPDDKIISCTQNDTQNYCRCPECTALAEKYGQSGALLTVINQIADAVKEKYPDKYIETFAYQYTRNAPKGGIVPRENVIIRLCSIECDFAHTFDNPNNKDFYKDFMDWKKICKTLYMWDYVSDFSDYIICHPNIQVLQKNIQLMTENNVVAVFEEGDYTNENSVLNHYKRYIISKLLWDPYLDMEKETKLFFRYFYGPAANDMMKFKDLIGKPFDRDQSLELKTFMHDCNYYNAKDWTDCYTALNSALKKVQGEANRKYYERVYTDFICFHAGWIHVKDEDIISKVRKAKVLPFETQKEFMENITEWGPAHGVTAFSEGRPLLDSIYALQKTVKEGTAPEECKDLKDEEWVDFQEKDLTQIFPGYGWSEIVDDPTASNGKALRMISKPVDWYIQKNIAFVYV